MILRLLLVLLCTSLAQALEYQITTTGNTKLLAAPGFLIVRRADWEMVIPGARVAYLLHAANESAFVIQPIPLIKDKATESEALIIRVRWTNEATRTRLMASFVTAMRQADGSAAPVAVDVE